VEYLAAVLLIAELIYCIVCAARLRKEGQTGRLAAWAVGLCAASDLALLLPLLLTAWLPALPAFWSPAGELADVLLSTGSWLLLYLYWERRFGGEIRDGLTFWTALGGALARLLVSAASGWALLRGADSRIWAMLRLLPLCFLAAAVTAVWRTLRLPRLRGLWLWLMAALALRLLTAGLDSVADPLLLRLPLLGVHAAIIFIFFEEDSK